MFAHQMPDGTEHSISYASRSLAPVGQKKTYSQLELERFHSYLYGRHLVIQSDQKPLQGLMGETKPVPQWHLLESRNEP